MNTDNTYVDVLYMNSIAEQDDPNELKHSKFANRFANSSNSQTLF